MLISGATLFKAHDEPILQDNENGGGTCRDVIALKDKNHE